MNTIALLFADIEQAPIITKRSQELWLGIQIKAPQNWQECASDDDATSLLAIHTVLQAKLAELRAMASRCAVASPSPRALISETLSSRDNIHGLRRSELRGYLGSVIADAERGDQAIADTAYDVAELLCLLPTVVLTFFAEVSRQSDQLPTSEGLSRWMLEHHCQDAWLSAEERAQQARTILVTGYLRYVLRIARNNMGQGVDYLDLVQEGVLGLMRAAERFDYREGARFATYASTWIWQSIGRAIADLGRTIRLPVHMHERVCSLQTRLEEEGIVEDFVSFTLSWLGVYGDDPSTKSDRKRERDASARTRLRAHRLLQYCQPPIPLDYELPATLVGRIGITEAEDVTLEDLVADQSIETTGTVQSDWEQLAQAVFDDADGLSERDREIVRMRYGLSDGYERTLEEVGQRFGVTRERIRQIERRALTKLAHPAHRRHMPLTEDTHYPQLPGAIQKHLDAQCGPLSIDRTDSVAAERDLVDRWLQRLPGGDWHGHRASGSGTRQDQIITAMRLLKTPAHYTTIAEQVNEIIDDTQLDESYVYGLLMRYEETFARLGEGYFGLADWERQRAVEIEPVLPYCTSPLPDPPDQPDAFFESVVIAQDLLQAPQTADSFLEALSKWAGLPWPQPRWTCHGALSAYYLVGAIPYTFYTAESSQTFSLTLPNTDLATLRELCLSSLSRRLVAMPEFWWLLRRHQPIRVTELAQLFVSVHPLGLDDVSNRLTLLTSIGAVQRVSTGGRYRLTPLGESLAAHWAKPPWCDDIAGDEPSTELEWSFADFSFD